ncbi:MAG: hypothetical protein WCL04_00320 [Verrucomicrobiota bacterium]
MKHSTDANQLRFIYEARIQEETAHPTPLTSDVLQNFQTCLVQIAHKGNILTADCWLSSLDPAVKAGRYDLSASILGQDHEISPGFRDAPWMWSIPLLAMIKDLPPQTPIIWTRGLQMDGTWRQDSPYGTTGGAIGFANGATRIYQGTVQGLVKWGTEMPTANIAETLPPGTRVGEHVLTPETGEHIRWHGRWTMIGTGVGLLVVGMVCGGTAFGRRHWLSLGIIGTSLVLQWWLARL